LIDGCSFFDCISEVFDINKLLTRNDELKTKVGDMELSGEKLRFRLEQAEATKAEVTQRLVSTTAARSRLERERDEIQREMQTAGEVFKAQLMSAERRVGELELTIGNQVKHLREYEEAFLAIHTGGKILFHFHLLLIRILEDCSRLSLRYFEGI